MYKELFKTQGVHLAYAFGFLTGVVTNYLFDLKPSKKTWNIIPDKDSNPGSIPPFVPYL